jgi:hypothetical protein
MPCRLAIALSLLLAIGSILPLHASEPTLPHDRAVSALLAGGDPAPARAAAIALGAACEQSRDAALCYRAAHARYVEAVLSLRGDRDAAITALVDCGVRLAPLQADPTWAAEAKALLSGCYGITIALNPMKGMTLGPDSARLVAEALAAAPDNPRVHYFAAMRLARTPPAWGGDPAQALDHAKRAMALAAAASTDAVPSWGAAEAAHLADELEAQAELPAAR